MGGGGGGGDGGVGGTQTSKRQCEIQYIRKSKIYDNFIFKKI